MSGKCDEPCDCKVDADKEIKKLEETSSRLAKLYGRTCKEKNEEIKALKEKLDEIEESISFIDDVDNPLVDKIKGILESKA